MAALPSLPDTTIRYEELVKKFCNQIDPYTIKSKCILPKNVQYYDIVNYCINNSSHYTTESFRAYKTLEAYKYFESGWV